MSIPNPYYQDESVCIYNADCRDILPHLDNIDFVLTDPPYGVSWKSNRRIIKHDAIENDDSIDWVVPIFDSIFRTMNDNRLMISFYGWSDAEVFLSSWKAAGFLPKSHLTWVKKNFGLGWFMRGQHEPAYLLAKGKPEKPETAISDIIVCDGTGNELHPSEKPVNLMTAWIQPFTKNGWTILDPFMGSGTTLRAAKDLGSKAIGIELNERYAEIAARRMAQEVMDLR